MKFFLLASLLLATSFATLSCGSQKDADKIGDAQLCLDKLGSSPASSDVDDCISKISGVSSAGAETLRCTAGFMKEGFASGKRFIDALSSVDNNTSSSSTLALMGVLTFTADSTVTKNYSVSSSTYTSCVASGGRGSTLLAAFSYLSMSLINFYHIKGAGTCPDTPSGTGNSGYKYYDLSSCASSDLVNSAKLVAAAAGSDTDVDTARGGIGAIVVGAYIASCQGTVANQQMCDIFSKAITAAGGTSASPANIAIQFFKVALGF